MVKKRGIRIRISHQRLEALVGICQQQLTTLVPANEHQHLLKEYLKELNHKLHSMMQKPQENYTLCLSGAEPTAFYQLWNLLDVSADAYGAVIVNTMLSKLSVLAA